MAAQAGIDIGRFIDERPLSRFHFAVVIACFGIILLDGYDIGALAFAAPTLTKAWGITSMKALGAALSAGLFGILFGAPILGYVGDRFGRRVAIAASCFVIGVFSLATSAAGSLETLIALRFLTGIGIGGMMPNVVALNAEFAPQRLRATMIILMFTGITLGGGLPGPVAARLVPLYGWQVLFLIGGVVPILLGIAVLLWLPESVKYLTVKGDRAAVIATLARMDPTLSIPPETRLILGEERVYRNFRPSQLFAGGLHTITPLLWLLFVCNLMSFYFVNSWLPTALPQAGVSAGDAAWATSCFQFGGTVGGIALSRLIDRYGLAPICALFALALAVTPLLGYAREPSTLLFGAAFVSGFALLGVQFGINALSALIYPTSIRSNGSGWAFGIGRLGSVSGPLIAGVLFDWHLSVEHLFLFPALPLAVATVASAVLALFYYRRFRGMGLDRRDVLATAAQAVPPGSASP